MTYCITEARDTAGDLLYWVARESQARTNAGRRRHMTAQTARMFRQIDGAHSVEVSFCEPGTAARRMGELYEQGILCRRGAGGSWRALV